MDGGVEQQIRVAVCIPARDSVHTSFALSLALMVAEFTKIAVRAGHEIQILTSQGTLIADQRAGLVDAAMKAKATHILWLDSDMKFPPDALLRLLDRNTSVVGANYATRRIPVKTVAFRDDTSWDCVYTTPESSGLEPVAAMGMGLMLVETSVYEAMSLPYFMIGYQAASASFVGEDVFFCRKARQAGFQIYVDHDLSKHVVHLGQFQFRHEHALADLEYERAAATGG